jgi:hypothetical protein
MDVVKRGSNTSEIDTLIPMPFLPDAEPGAASAELIDEANDIVDGMLNAQGTLLTTWRQQLISLLTRSLNSDGEEAENVDGEEYNRSLETQGRAEVLLQQIVDLAADYRQALVAERTILNTHLAHQRKAGRNTKAARDAVAAAAEMVVDSVMAEAAGNVDDVFAAELTSAREKIMLDFSGRAVKSVLYDLIPFQGIFCALRILGITHSELQVEAERWRRKSSQRLSGNCGSSFVNGVSCFASPCYGAHAAIQVLCLTNWTQIWPTIEGRSTTESRRHSHTARVLLLTRRAHAATSDSSKRSPILSWTSSGLALRPLPLTKLRKIELCSRTRLEPRGHVIGEYYILPHRATPNATSQISGEHGERR